jgi:hypothetical protein
VANNSNSNQFAALATIDTDHSQSCSQSETEQPFTEYSSSRIRRKRRRRQSRPSPQQQPIIQATGEHQMTVTDGNKSSHVPQRAPLVIGKSLNITAASCKITAARPLIKKAVFYIDNVGSCVTADDLSEFVRSLSVDVISCFEAKPRKRHADKNINPTDCKAFRLCVSDESRERLLNADNWPAYISISEWFFKAKQHDEHNLARNEEHSAIITTEVITETSADGNVDMESTILADSLTSNNSLSDTISYNGVNN